jgi:choline-sulfatase
MKFMRLLLKVIIFFMLLLLTAVIFSGAGPSAPSPAIVSPKPSSAAPPSLLIITIDTWRWDYIGAAGTGKVRTPNMDRLAKEGIYEREAVTPCPLTTPAHASLFSGLLPQKHGVLDCVGFVLKPGVATLAESFKKAGYLTAAFVSSDSVARRFGLDRGFDHYNDSGIGKRSKDDWLFGTKDGALTTAAALEYMAHNYDKPLFLWVHYFDLHAPYRNRPIFDGKYPGNRYAAEVAFVDEQVGKLVSACEKISGSGKWRVVIVGDHGEGMGDHDEMGHGMALYRSTVHVPLVIYPKPRAALMHDRPWSLLDIDPTVREWFGLKPQAGQDGETLFKMGTPGRPIPMLTLMPTFTFAVEPVLGIRKDNYSYIRFGSEELYDTSTDPEEQKNLVLLPGMKDILANLRSKCDAVFPPGMLQPIMTPTLKSSAEELNSLMGLGYIGGSAPSLSNLQKADMATMLADWKFLQENWEEGFKNGKPLQVKSAFFEMVKKYPNAPVILRTYGKFCLKTGDYPQALQTFERIVKNDPADEEALVNLGTLYLMQGKAEKARVVLEAAEAINPDDSVCQKNLGLLYGDILKQPVKAIPHYQKYLELEPNSPDAASIRAYVARETKGTGAVR